MYLYLVLQYEFERLLSVFLIVVSITDFLYFIF